MISKLASVTSSVIGRVKFRPIQKKDISAVIDIVKQNYKVDHHEIPFVYSAYPDFLRVAELDGTIVGCSCAAIHGRFAVLGFLNVTKQCRGVGIGQLLTQLTLDLIPGKHRIGHVESVEKFKSVLSEFVECKYIDVEMRYDNMKFEKLMDLDFSGENGIADPAFIRFSNLVDYDAGIHVVPRERFLKSMLNWPYFRTRVSTDRTGRINGYGTLRVVDSKYAEISPLFAESDAIARALFVDLCRLCFNGQTVMFTTVDTNRTFLDEIKKTIDIKETGVFFRAVDKPTGVPLHKVYGVSSSNIAVI